MDSNYSIKYTATDTAKPVIASLGDSLKNLATWADESRKKVSAIGGSGTVKGMDQLASNLNKIGSTNPFTGINDALLDMASYATSSTASMGRLKQALTDVALSARSIDRVADSTVRLGIAADKAVQNLRGTAQAAGTLGSQTGAVDSLKTSVEGVQRKAYGLSKNLQDASANLGKLTSQAGNVGSIGQNFTAAGTGAKSAATGIRGVAKSVSGVAKGMGRSAILTAKFGTSLDGLFARIAIAQQLQQAIAGIGTALKDARSTASEGAKSNLDLRDEYRELANLQGKAEPDNAVVGGALKFRIKTGTTNQDANEALRRFEGGLPAAVAAGNITGDSTTGLAGDLFAATAQTGLRAGVKGGTSGLLTAKLAQNRKIDSVDQGVGRFGAIIDTLNRGDGDVDPLVEALVKRSGGFVGPGLAFSTLEEFAAAQSTASLNAAPGVAGTRVQQAARALNRFGDRADKPVLKTVEPPKDANDPKQQARYQKKLAEAKAKYDDDVAKFKPKAGDTLEKLGITNGTSFPDKIEKLGDSLKGSANPDADLQGMGFVNSQERASLLQFVTNRSFLRRETDTVRKGGDVADINAKNARYMSSDGAQQRVANAENDASKFAAYTDQEPVVVGRIKAEAQLRREGKLDTGWSNITDTVADNPIVRAGAGLVDLATLHKTPTDQLPIFMGGKGMRDQRVDREAERQARQAAVAAGVDPERAVVNRLPDGASTVEQRIPVINAATREKGGNPFAGSGGANNGLDILIREAENQTKLLETLVGKAKKQDFLPMAPRNGAQP